jgi:predicted nucleotidyltransferase
MHEFLEKHLDEIILLCSKNKVKKLAVFGSVLTDSFAEESDVDFLVSFDENLTPFEFSDAYFNLLFGLEILLKRKIDLVSESSIRNKIFRSEIDKQKLSLYAA